MQTYPLKILQYPLPLEYLKDINGNPIDDLYIAGGAVRDSILGIQPNDIDFYPMTPKALDLLLEKLKASKATATVKNDILIEGDLSYIPFAKFQEERITMSYDIIMHCIEETRAITTIIDRFDFKFNKVLVNHKNVYTEYMYNIKSTNDRMVFRADLHPIKHYQRMIKFIHRGFTIYDIDKWLTQYSQIFLEMDKIYEAFALAMVIRNITPEDLKTEYKYIPRINLNTVNLSYPHSRSASSTNNDKELFKQILKSLEKIYCKGTIPKENIHRIIFNFYDDIVFNNIVVDTERYSETKEVIKKYEVQSESDAKMKAEDVLETPTFTWTNTFPEDVPQTPEEAEND